MAAMRIPSWRRVFSAPHQFKVTLPPYVWARLQPAYLVVGRGSATATEVSSLVCQLSYARRRVRRTVIQSHDRAASAAVHMHGFVMELWMHRTQRYFPNRDTSCREPWAFSMQSVHFVFQKSEALNYFDNCCDKA